MRGIADALIKNREFGAPIYENFLLKVLMVIVKAKLFDILWDDAASFKPSGAHAVYRKLEDHEGVGEKVGIDSADLKLAEANFKARFTILDHLKMVLGKMIFCNSSS